MEFRQASIRPFPGFTSGPTHRRSRGMSVACEVRAKHHRTRANSHVHAHWRSCAHRHLCTGEARRTHTTIGSCAQFQPSPCVHAGRLQTKRSFCCTLRTTPPSRAHNMQPATRTDSTPFVGLSVNDLLVRFPAHPQEDHHQHRHMHGHFGHLLSFGGILCLPCNHGCC